MSVRHVQYPLQNGFVDHWLVAGPLATAADDQRDVSGDAPIPPSGRESPRRQPPNASTAVEGRRVAPEGDAPADPSQRWSYYRCPVDHYVDLTRDSAGRLPRKAWASTRLATAVARPVNLTLTTTGPADLWLNGRHVHHQGGPGLHPPHRTFVPVALEPGDNEVVVSFESGALPESPHAMALRVTATGDEPDATDGDPATILLPTLVVDVHHRQTLERMFEAAYLDRDVYAGDDEIVVRLPEGMEAPVDAVVRLQTPTGRIYFESLGLGPSAQGLGPGTGSHASLGRAHDIPEGRYAAFLMPPLERYYMGDMRIHRKIGLWALTNPFSLAPYGTYEERRLEALEDAARRGDGIVSEVAKMALDRWPEVAAGAILDAIEAVDRRADGGGRDLLTLVGMVTRFGGHPSFPEELLEPLERSILGFRYRMDEPDGDPMPSRSESGQILLHACEVLAGQRYPDRVFTDTGQTGDRRRAQGERRAIDWLQQRGTRGFRDWDSGFADDLVALSHLADLAATPQVYDLAAAVLDKILFSIALNSFRGVLGSTQGTAGAQGVKTGRLQAVSGVSRLLWGTGAFNHHAAAAVSLACAESYEAPPHVARIAADPSDEMWNRERHAGDVQGPTGKATGWEVNKVSYRTPDGMLCSAQDYRKGARGRSEHVWQATLGADAVVFVNHPACCSEDDARRPNFWAGNAVLPRVAQWKDVLIAVYRQPEDDWLGFTHAYFPIRAFDDSATRSAPNGRRWAFAHKGRGYLALTAARGLDATISGASAYRELRSYGNRNVWVCHLGRAALDGDFAAFQERVLALDVRFDELSARVPTLRGETLAFGWEGPLLRNGREEPTAGFMHYENPYCVADLPAPRMDIQFGDQVLRLNFD